MTPEKIVQILEYLAKSPFVQSELEAAKVAIFTFAEAEAKKAIPYGLRTSSRILRWIYKNFKGVYLTMQFNLQRFAEEETTTSTETTADTETVAAEVAADEAEATEDATETTGSATITVLASAGTALEGAAVSYVINSATCDGTTDSNGQLSVTDLPAGTYTFTATLDSYASGTVEVTVVAAETATGTITLTAETTTEGESTMSTIEDAAKTAAVDAAISTAASTITSVVSGNSGLISAVTTEIARLTAEIGTTKDLFVKVRNAAEVTLLSALLAGLTAGSVAAVKALEERFK
ncbi:MAG: hypothetical protein H6Q72_4594 [Firmicutes bacterium]|nr:hypothetical protein [Bacillota bacterium]